MTRGKQVLGLLLLCAVCVCGFGAANASATTFFECRQAAVPHTATFTDSNCTNMSFTNTGDFTRVVVSANFPTIVRADPVPLSQFVFKANVGGIEVQIQCSKAAFAGTGTNQEVEGLMQYVGTSISVAFGECTVSKPVGGNCKVKGSGFEIPNAKSTTFMKTETETREKFTPTSGSVLAELTLEGCKVGAMNATFKLEGGVVGIPIGSNLSFTAQSSEEGGLKFAGNAVKMEGESVMGAVMPEEEGGATTSTGVE